MEYLFKSTACLGVLTLFYWLSVKNLTFHKVNRYILGVVFILSLTLPLVKYDLPFYPIKYLSFDYFKVQDTYTYEDNSFFTEAVITSTSESTINKPTPIDFEESQSYLSQYTIWDYTALVYLIGLSFFLTRFVIQWISLFRFFSSAHKIEGRHPTPFYTSLTEVPPFCFFNRIVIPSSFLTHPELDLILSHEKIHQRNGHTYDIFIAEMVKVVHWFNPCAWLYNRMVKENLEYLTDSHIVKKGYDKQEYQHCLVNTTLNMQPVPLTNCFASSLIKKRIVMMNKKQNRKIAVLRYALILIPIFVLTSSFNVGTEQEITSETWEDTLENFEEYHFIVGPKATVEELTQLKEDLADQLKVKLVFDELKFNDHLEISSLIATFYSSEGGKLSINATHDAEGKHILPFRYKKTSNAEGLGRLNKDLVLEIWGKQEKGQARLFLYGISDFESLDVTYPTLNKGDDIEYAYMIDGKSHKKSNEKASFPINPKFIKEVSETLTTGTGGRKKMLVYINLNPKIKRSLPLYEYPENWKIAKSRSVYEYIDENKIAQLHNQLYGLPFPANYYIDGLPASSDVLLEYESIEKVEIETYFLSPKNQMPPVTQITEVKVSTKGFTNSKSIFNNKGQKSKRTLVDGSLVWLNSETVLNYSDDYSKKKRDLSLIKGEVYFEITEHKIPFKIAYGNLVVRGEEQSNLMINTYNDKKVEISIVKGKVSLLVMDNGRTVSERRLSAGNSYTYNLSNGLVTNADLIKTEVLAWKNGILTFKQDGHNEVIKKLERWYGIDITVQGQAKNTLLTDSFRDKELENVLQDLSEKLGFKYSINEKLVTISF